MGICTSQPKYQELHQTFVKMNISNSGHVTYKEFLNSTFCKHLQPLRIIILNDFFKYGSNHQQCLSFDTFLDYSQSLFQQSSCIPFTTINQDQKISALNEDQTQQYGLMQQPQTDEIYDVRTMVEKMVDGSKNASELDQFSISQALGLNSRGLDVVFRQDAFNDKIEQDYITEHDICLLIDQLAAQGIDLSGLVSTLKPSSPTSENSNKVEDFNDIKLSRLLIKEYDSTHSGTLSSIEFDGLMRALNTELQAHQTFLGADLKIIGEYITGRTLGFGKTGIVKCAIKKNDIQQKEICLKISQIQNKKISKQSFFTGENYCTQLPEENFLSLAQSEYIVQFYESFIHKDKNGNQWSVIVVDLCGGGSLAEYCHSTSITEPIARYFFTQILLGIEHLHNLKIAHLDIRLQNILIDSNGDARICDFGNSVHMEPGFMLKAGTIAGTLSHMPPEMLLFCEDFDAKCVDMWQCGLILYELLTGKPLFSCKNDSVVQQIKNSTFEPLSYQFSKEARELVNQLLQPTPENRLTVQEALDSEWLQLPLHKPAIAKGFIILDPAPLLSELCMKIEHIFKGESVQFTENDAKNKDILAFKCQYKGVTFTMQCERIKKVEKIDEIELSQRAVQSKVGSREIEDYIIGQFAQSQKVVKITFFLRQGVLWDFQKIFKRIRFLIMKTERAEDIGVEEVLILRSESYVDEESGVTVNNHSFVVKERLFGSSDRGAE
ncbi:Kinase [Spironucleus salmonicida]|uniref:Kinase n=1 Tax=Spironucleus salmonicida TaxID=348837 RepID=V6LVH9_9EUKA|nr:Kinase [Spironucleus salmonicida]|eukprot:EST44814.1 Kinase [Spironucleus salmonicida]